MKKGKFWWLLGLIVFFGLRSSLIFAAEWAMFRMDKSHSAFNPETLAPPINLAWKYPTGREIVSSPTVGQGLVYFGSRDNNVYALNAQTGALKWRFTTGGWVDCAPALSEGTLYFTSRDGYLYALQANTGELKWKFFAGGTHCSSPAVDKNTVYFGAGAPNKEIYAVDARSGTLKWKYPTKQYIYSSPAVVNGVVYIGSDDGIFYALDAGSGALKWQFQTKGGIYFNSPTIAEKTFFGLPGDWDKNIYALDATSGTLKWKFVSGRSAKYIYVSSLALAKGVVYFAVGDPKTGATIVYALDAQTGTKKWECLLGTPTAQGYISSPAIAEDVLYVGCGDGNVYAVDINRGEKIWQYKTGGPVISSPTISNGMVYVGSFDGNLYAFSGRLRHRFPKGLQMVSVPMVLDNPAVEQVFEAKSGEDLKIARWKPDEPSENKYKYYPDAFVSEILPGAAYWAKFEKERTVELSGGRADPSLGYLIALKPGWNQIGNPFFSNIPWRDIKVKLVGKGEEESVDLQTAAMKGWLKDYAWGYDANNGYQLVYKEDFLKTLKELEPWKGYWVKASQECELVVPARLRGAESSESATRSQKPASQKPAAANEKDWDLQLIVTATSKQGGMVRDTFNYLGVKPEGKYAIESPPVISPYVDLYFTEPKAEQERKAVDFRAPLAGKTSWEFEVKTDLGDAEIAITWPDMTRVPKAYRLTLVDKDLNKRQYMRTTSVYVYRSEPSGGLRHFKVEVEPLGRAPLLISNVTSTPWRSGGTTISFVLSESAEVTANVYSLTGRLVKILVAQASKGAGINTLSWDGRDGTGALVPNGLYLCQVTAVDPEGRSQRATTVLRVIRP